MKDTRLSVREFWILARGKRSYLNVAIFYYFCHGEPIQDIAERSGIKPCLLYQKAGRIRAVLYDIESAVRHTEKQA